MSKAIKITGAALVSLFLFFIFAQAAEELTITTYYPSPYGSYRELRAKKMLIGDNYIGSNYCISPDPYDPAACEYPASPEGDLVVEGRIGIGNPGPEKDDWTTQGHRFPGASLDIRTAESYLENVGGIYVETSDPDVTAGIILSSMGIAKGSIYMGQAEQPGHGVVEAEPGDSVIGQMGGDQHRLIFGTHSYVDNKVHGAVVINSQGQVGIGTRVGTDLNDPWGILEARAASPNINYPSLNAAVAGGTLPDGSPSADLRIFLVPWLDNGGYNSISSSGDKGIFWSSPTTPPTNNDNSTGDLVIAPWKSAQIPPIAGIKITDEGTVSIGSNLVDDNIPRVMRLYVDGNGMPQDGFGENYAAVFVNGNTAFINSSVSIGRNIYPPPQGGQGPTIRDLQIGADAGGLGISKSDGAWDNSEAPPSRAACYLRFGDNMNWKMYIGRAKESPSSDPNPDTNPPTGVIVTIVDTGNVGIGTMYPQYRLHIVGDLFLTGEIFTGDPNNPTQISVTDYVFAENYDLKPLSWVKNYVTKNKHLPGFPGGKDRDGWAALSLQDRDMKLLEKIEELTLYVIKLEEEITALKKQFKNN